MKQLRIGIAVLLALCLTAGGCAAPRTGESSSVSAVSSRALAEKTASSSSSSSQSSVTRPDTFTLPAVFSQAMNPLTTGCMQNLVLWPLLFDSLAQPDASFTAQPGLASDVRVNGSTVTAALRGGVQFSDGSALTSADVVYSYNLVKATPSSYFYSNVQNIASVTAQGSNTVVFTFSSPDVLAENLLDIPIIKANSDKAVNAAYPNQPPVGSGPYTLSMAAVGGTLTLNKNWYGGSSHFGFQTIALDNIHNTDAIASSLKIGAVNYLFTDYGQTETSVPNMQTKAVNLNRMVFLGINSAHAAVADAHVRRAISLLIDRSSLVTDAFSSQALATNLPYNPDWAGGQKPQAADLSVQTDKAVSELAQAGYTVRGGSGGTYTKANGSSPLTLTLLYNSDNSRMTSAATAIAQSLTKAGVSVTAAGKPFAAYTAALQAGGYDLYLGDVALTDDMDLSPLLAQGGGASYGVPANGATLAAFRAWRAGGALSGLTAAFEKELPFLPLCFRTGTVSYTPGLSGSVTPTARNIFYGIAGWHY